MKNVSMVVVAVIVIAMAGTVFAAPTVDVQATVQSKCGFPVNGAFDVLSIDPTLGDQPFVVATDATIKCTKNKVIAPGSITAESLYGTSNGSPVTCDGTLIPGFAMQSASALQINYSFSCNASITGTGFGVADNVPLGIGASVLAVDAATADYDNGNTYSDTVTLTITY